MALFSLLGLLFVLYILGFIFIADTHWFGYQPADNLKGLIEQLEGDFKLGGLDRIYTSQVQVRQTAAEALAEYRGSEAVASLYKALDDKSSLVSQAAAISLVKISSQQALDYLLVDLKNKDKPLYRRKLSAWVLEAKDTKESKKAVDIFLEENSINLSQVKDKYAQLIRAGRDNTEYLLALALQRYGDLDMAIDFINSGSPGSFLEKVGRLWADRRGYSIKIVPGRTTLRWGN